MHRVILADQSGDFSTLLSGALQSRFQVEVCDSGLQLLERLRRGRADVLILDLMMSGTDSLHLLEIVRREDLASAVIVTSLFYSDYLARCLPRYGVDYAVRKPCSISGLVQRVEELCEDLTLPEPDTHCAVTAILLSMGFQTSKKGFRYIRESILLLSRDPALQITKTVYPQVAKACGVNPCGVEKAIRAAIASAWASRDDALWRLYFPAAPGGQVCRPTNSAFLTRIADALAADSRQRRA